MLFSSDLGHDVLFGGDICSNEGENCEDSIEHVGC